jgi:glycosyltransferase involved in cell wall biosynthesis
LNDCRPAALTRPRTTKRGSPASWDIGERPTILFVDQAGELGGAELSLLDIARHYARTGCVVLFRDGPFERALAAAGVRTVLVPAAAPLMEVRRDGGIASSFAALGALSRVVRHLARLSRGRELIYANTQKAFVASAIAGLVARKPVVWHLRDILAPEHFSRSNLRLVIALTWLPHVRVIANSQATAQAFVAAGGSGRRVVAIPNGIDPGPFAPVDPESLARLRAELSLGPGPIVGLFGRLAAWKGQHVLADAMAQIPGAQAICVGGALFGEEPYERALEAQLAQSGLAERVRLTGFRSDVPALMQLCDVVVHASIAPEPFGRVVVEAMLSGRPVIASKAGGIAEIVEDGRSGLLIEPGDPDVLAAAIRRLLDDRALAGQLADAGRRRALASFGLAANLAQIDAFLATLTSRADAGEPAAAAR